MDELIQPVKDEAAPLIKLTPQHDGVNAECHCGAVMHIPTDSAKRFRLVWCPCGALQPIDSKHFSRIMTIQFADYLEGVGTGKPSKPDAN